MCRGSARAECQSCLAKNAGAGGLAAPLGPVCAECAECATWSGGACAAGAARTGPGPDGLEQGHTGNTDYIYCRGAAVVVSPAITVFRPDPHPLPLDPTPTRWQKANKNLSKNAETCVSSCPKALTGYFGCLDSTFPRIVRAFCKHDTSLLEN